MPVHNVEALQEPFQPEKLSQLRTGHIRPVFGVPLLTSAIFKTPRKEPVKVAKLGLEGDQHAFEFHGGPEKALLHYCSRHYESWKEELPYSSHLFSVGGFGENLVSSNANEQNICIGDVISIGEVVVQVTNPRQPCFKLNHRFEVKDMSRRSQTLARTGWYYRILEEGYIREDNEIRLIKRINPRWTVANVQHYLYIDMKNEAVMKELVELEGLGAETRNIFRNRLNKNFENQDQRLVGDTTMAMKQWVEYRLAEKRMETSRVASFCFEAVVPAEDPTKVLPGSHVRVKLGGKLVRAYSVVGGDTNSFELGIAQDPDSRGGSRFLHEVAKKGDVLQFGEIRTTFPLSDAADHHIMIAGGIGITALIATAQFLQRINQSYELHYAVNSIADVPFKRYLDDLGDGVVFYDKSKGNRMNVSKILARNSDSSHVYCCGPIRLMEGVSKAAKDCGMPEDQVHFETFTVTSSGDPFTAELAVTKKTMEIGSSQSLLDVLREAGLEIDSSCEVGNCGTCRVNVKCGRIEHRGTALMASEQGMAMLSCVSRGVGQIVLDM
jgi:MOSC domain-containing protein YiiM/ferredoxin-NADP reductase